jgi:glycosyltransferase involved in cell wall biosynthesis
MAGPGVIFAGFRSGAQLTALYRRAARFLHPSEMEGFGLVVLEALSMGAPVSLSDIAVHREFELPDDSFFPVGDIQAIRDVMADTGPREAPWPPAAAIVGRHSPLASALAHAALFRGLMQRPSAHAYDTRTVADTSSASNIAQ